MTALILIYDLVAMAALVFSLCCGTAADLVAAFLGGRCRRPRRLIILANSQTGLSLGLFGVLSIIRRCGPTRSRSEMPTTSRRWPRPADGHVLGGDPAAGVAHCPILVAHSPSAIEA